MTNEFKNFKFPTYEEIEHANLAFIEHEEYKGYAINIPVNDFGLYILIDCQNDNVLGMGENCIRFAWCNKAGFAVASQKYINSEAGYIAGCAFLIESAYNMMKCFTNFINTNLKDIEARIHIYNENNPE